MKVIESSWELADPKDLQEGVSKLRKIEYYGRYSHRTEEKQTDDSWHKFIISWVLGHGDWSITEHEKATVIFRVDRGITHEIVRHRLFSYTQESTRFVNYGKRGEIEFVLPTFSEFKSDFDRTYWEMAMVDFEKAYFDLLKAGQPPQIARSVLPQATASSIVMTGNLRSWRHFFSMRTTLETHPDMKKVTIPLLAEFQYRIPLLYNDITPNERQITSMSRAK